MMGIEDSKVKKRYYERMKITIALNCPHCRSSTIVRNGKKYNGSHNYKCKVCGKQFISDHERKYEGSMSWISSMIKIMLVHGNGIRDISAVLKISVGKVLKTLKSSRYEIKYIKSIMTP